MLVNTTCQMLIEREELACSDHDELENTPISTPLRMSNIGTLSTPQSVRRYIDGLNTPSISIIKVNIM